MKLLLIGDTHGEHIRLINAYVSEAKSQFGVDVDAVIHVGDFGFYRSIPNWYRLRHGITSLLKPTYVAYGNHEDIQEVRLLANKKIVVPNLFVPHTGEIVDLNGYKIQFLGGAITPKTAVQKDTIPWTETDVHVAISKWRYYDCPKIDLLVTHEAPSGIGPIGDSMYGDPYSAGSPAIRELWETVRPTLMICGHYHKSYGYREKGLHLRILEEAKSSATVLDTDSGMMLQIK